MSNIIQIKRGWGEPSQDALELGELGIDMTTKKLYIGYANPKEDTPEPEVISDINLLSGVAQTVNEAASDAINAVSTANGAVSTANGAYQTADDAYQMADNALQAANSAATTANSVATQISDINSDISDINSDISTIINYIKDLAEALYHEQIQTPELPSDW